jgi:hypothetical protein
MFMLYRNIFEIYVDSNIILKVENEIYYLEFYLVRGSNGS